MAAQCASGREYAESGLVCTCNQNKIECMEFSFDCFCPSGTYINAQNECTPQADCHRESFIHLSRRDILMTVVIMMSLIISAPCDGGKVYSDEGGGNCLCDPNAGLQCTLVETPGCYCPRETYPNAEGVCTPEAECQRE